MKVYYTGTAKGRVEAYGAVFEDGKAAEVNDRFAKKIAGNPYFSTEAAGRKTVKEEPEAPKFEARHKGGGSYSVFRGDAEVMDKLSKADADAFNAFSDAEKADYLNKND